MVKTLVVKISHSHCRGCGLELRFHMCILRQKKKIRLENRLHSICEELHKKEIIFSFVIKFLKCGSTG